MPENEPLVIVPGDVDQARGYKAGVWAPKNGEGVIRATYVNYECLRCSYSTIFEPRMKAHVAEGKHPWGFPGRGTNALRDGFSAKAEPEAPKLVY